MTVAWQVQAPEQAAYKAEVSSFIRDRRRMDRAVSVGLGVILAGSMLANIGLAGATWLLISRQEIVPVFYQLHDDGSIDAQTRISALPSTQNEAVIRSSLETYVELCEGYSYAGAPENYKRCQMMSAEPVAATHRKRFFDTDGTQKKFAEKGQIVVKIIGSYLTSEHVMRVRYQRTEYDSPPYAGCPPQACQTWTATMWFELVEAIPAESRRWNPGGVVVTRYQTAQGAL